MARRNNKQQAQPAAEPEVNTAAVEVEASIEERPDNAEPGEQVDGQGLDPVSGSSDPEPPAEPTETVRALVLHDSGYGKCGEVKDFPAAQAEAIAAAGYIDTHPNAVKSAED